MVDKFEIYVPMQSSPGGRVYVVSVYVQNRSMNKCVDVPATHRSLPAVEYARTWCPHVFPCVHMCVCVCVCVCVYVRTYVCDFQTDVCWWTCYRDQ